MNQKRLFFDIETLANPETYGLMPEPKAPANLKDPEKIAQAIVDKRQEMIDNAALDPDYGQILSIGYTTDIDGPVTVHTLGEVYFAEQVSSELQTNVLATIEYPGKKSNTRTVICISRKRRSDYPRVVPPNERGLFQALINRAARYIWAATSTPPPKY